MEEELSRQFGKLSAAGESDSREEQSEDFESQHDLNDSDSNGKCNLIVNYLPHDFDDISLKVKFIIWYGRGVHFLNISSYILYCRLYLPNSERLS